MTTPRNKRDRWIKGKAPESSIPRGVIVHKPAIPPTLARLERRLRAAEKELDVTRAALARANALTLWLEDDKQDLARIARDAQAREAELIKKLTPEAIRAKLADVSFAGGFGHLQPFEIDRIIAAICGGEKNS